MKATCYPVIDLFAGPGGLGEGFASVRRGKEPTFKSLAAIERDESAHRTLHLRHFVREFADAIPTEYYDYLAGKLTREDLRQTFPSEWKAAEHSALKLSLGEENHEHVKAMITKRLRGHKKWVLVGGPPCQAYSLVGRSRRAHDPNFERDEKHFLYREYLKIITDHRPPVFVMENVKGLLSAKVGGKPVIDRILSDLSRPKAATTECGNGLRYRLFSLTERGELVEGASPNSFIVRAEEHGVPQARHRMFIVGVRSDLDIEPDILKKQSSPSVQDVIDDLPAIRSGISKEPDSYSSWSNAILEICGTEWLTRAVDQKEITRYSKKAGSSLPANRSSTFCTQPRAMSRWFGDKDLPIITCHEARSHMRTDLQRYFFAALFAKQTGVSPKLIDFPEELLPNHRNVEAGRAGTMFSDRFRVQVADRVSTTVTSHISKDGHYFIHYDPRQCRSLTVREAARLQTFPDNYHFEGPRTQQYHQVGNAVPPFLANQIGEIVADVLDRIGGV